MLFIIKSFLINTQLYFAYQTQTNQNSFMINKTFKLRFPENSKTQNTLEDFPAEKHLNPYSEDSPFPLIPSGLKYNKPYL